VWEIDARTRFAAMHPHHLSALLALLVGVVAVAVTGSVSMIRLQHVKSSQSSVNNQLGDSVNRFLSTNDTYTALLMQVNDFSRAYGYINQAIPVASLAVSLLETQPSLSADVRFSSLASASSAALFAANATSGALRDWSSSSLPSARALASTVSSFVSPGAMVWHLVIAAGQSNMVGNGHERWGFNGVYFADADSNNQPDSRIWQWPSSGIRGRVPFDQTNQVYAQYGKIVPAINPLLWYEAGMTAQISSPIPYCKAEAKKYPSNHRWLIVPAAWGGTGLIGLGGPGSPTWQPNTTNAPGGELFEAAIVSANSAYAAVSPSDVTFLWIQGEQDAGGGKIYSDYQPVFDQMITSFRSRVQGAANAPFLVGSTVKEYFQYMGGGGAASQRASIDLAHSDTPRRLQFTSYISPPYGCFDALDNGIHYADDCMNDIGNLFSSVGLPSAMGNNQSVIPGVFQGLAAELLSPLTVALYWNATVPYSRVTDFTVQYRLTGSGAAYQTAARTPFSPVNPMARLWRQFNLTLPSDGTYDIRIAAVNEKGSGAFTAPIQVAVFSTGSIFSLKALSSTRTSVTLKWNADPSAVDYVIRYSISGANSYAVFNHTSLPFSSAIAVLGAASTIQTSLGIVAETRVTVTGLTPGVFYDFGVSMVLSNGTTLFENGIFRVDTDTVALVQGVPVPIPVFRIRSDRGLHFDSNGNVDALIDQIGQLALTLPNPAPPSSLPKAIPAQAETFQGCPVIRCRQQGQGFFSATGFPVGADFTIIVIAALGPLEGGGNILGGNSGRTIWRNGGKTVSANAQADPRFSGSIPVNANVFESYAVTTNSTDAQKVTMYRNGFVDPISSPGVDTSGKSTDPTISINSYNGGNFGTMRLVAAEIFNVSLTQAQVQAENARLCAYYNITV
jgi:hypothetical protein